MILRNTNNQAECALETAHTPPVKIWPAVAIALGLAAFAFYKYILRFYYSGDPFWYQIYYDSLFGADVFTAWTSQYNYIGSSEIIYPAIAWAGSNVGIERNTLMAVFDGILYFSLSGLLLKRKCNFAYILLTFTNFYVVVLCTSAERLKFSYIFLFFALLVTRKYKVFWVALAPLAHFQTIITGSSIIIFNLLDKTSVRTKIIILLFVSLGGGGMMYLFSSALLAKFSSYSNDVSPLDALPSLAMLLISLFVFEKKASSASSLLLLVVLSAILGGERVNMITFTVFSYIVLSERKTSHPVVIMIMCYFSFKSFGYIQNIFAYGNGFASG